MFRKLCFMLKKTLLPPMYFVLIKHSAMSVTSQCWETIEAK